MGSPVSVAVSDLHMEELEERAMEEATDEVRLKIWKRYIDDSFEVLKKEQTYQPPQYHGSHRQHQLY